MTENQPGEAPEAQLPVHRDPHLIVTAWSMQYRMPSAPMCCPLCGASQWWEMDTSRYISRRPEPSPAPVVPLLAPSAPLPADPTDPPDRQHSEPDPEPVYQAPPGWGLVRCRRCDGVLMLVLRSMPAIGLHNPPALIEISMAQLRYTTVQFRLPDCQTTAEQRWRTAFVTKQHTMNRLDARVMLETSDPEYLRLVVRSLQAVQFRLPDRLPDVDSPDGAPVERWRTALVSAVHKENALALTVHFHESDPEDGAWRRIESATLGQNVGQWRLPTDQPLMMLAKNAERGTRIGQWLPVGNQ